ncbi:SDR family NAD(P)-dependent oxidoreductase [Butyrivibrio sp. VCB2001]|uniref:SDR family NAD(P)-dependent oxidoreductase n=1 Tax=Butyrivibrio sp. VCB2001 TaxID=1280667 RepID=UPI0004269C7C|nr:SDR family oxidoreductase [Butyrivibrio sp. VCB2001]
MKHSKYFVVITGASSGIGMEFAKRFAKEGYSLVLVARRENRLLELSKQLEKVMDSDAKCLVIPKDLGDIQQCKELADRLEKEPVSIFINNAGFGDCGKFTETDLNKDLDMIDLNIKAMHYFTKRMLRKFSDQGGGYLLNVASSAGLIPAGPFMATYYATKSYVVSLTRAIARELSETGSKIYIGCLCPGPVDTEFNENANVEFALKGITAEYCANYAVDMMKKRKVVIIPTALMKVAISAGRFIPQNLYIASVSRQQKKKMK